MRINGVQINGEALRALRKAMGLSGSRLAQRAGISPQHLSDIERGTRNPSPEVAKAIADALGQPIGVLVLGDTEVAS